MARVDKQKQSGPGCPALAEMVDINQAQREFYSASRKTGGPGRLWSRLRARLGRFRGALGIKMQVYDLHREWLGDLKGRRVLDLGCFSGNALSVEIASVADRYVGIDLSLPAIETLASKLAHLPNAEVRAEDFLEVQDLGRFDVIYAYSVLHHFRHLEIVLERLDEHLAPDGVLVSYDPLETSLPVWIARRLYRPFQADSAWEWPFGRGAVRALTSRFEPIGVQGILGRSKWALALAVFAPSLGEQLGRRWHAHDLRAAVRPGRALYACMHLTMCLQKRS